MNDTLCLLSIWPGHFAGAKVSFCEVFADYTFQKNVPKHL